jgi:hypothetical protein
MMPTTLPRRSLALLALNLLLIPAISQAGTPAITVPASVAFGSQTVGTSSTAQMITVLNSGTANLVISSVTLTGANVPSFAITTNNCTTPVTPAIQCTIFVTFTPTSTGAKSASLSIVSNAPGSPTAVPMTGTGTSGPALSRSTASIAFGNEGDGVSSSARMITVTNTGGATLTISAVSLTGANVPSFSQMSNCVTSLAPTDTCTISVTFTPPSSGAKSANVSIASNAPGSPAIVSMTGTGVAEPAVSLSAPSVAFGSQAVGVASSAHVITVTNTGAAVLNISSVSLAGVNVPAFSQMNTCSAPIAVSGTCTISVTFTPPSTGAKSASVSILSNALSSPTSIPLTGTGTSGAPAISLSAPSIAFGSQAVGVASSAHVITVTNTGTAALTISTVSLTGANVPAFSQMNTCGAPLAVSGTCTISVTFTPPSAGAKSASVSIASNAAGSPSTVSLTGTGSSGAPAISLSAPSIAFGSQTDGVASSAQVITVTNTGTAALTISTVSLTGANVPSFSQMNTCSAPLAVSGTCTISVTFTPPSAGAKSASVSIVSNAPSSPSTVTLTGTGVASGSTFTLSGTVSGAWQEHVALTLSGAGSGSFTTTASGAYSFPGLAAGSYTVTPSLDGYTFTPSSQTLTLSGSTTLNFSSTPLYGAPGLSGTISYAGAASGTVLVHVYQSCGAGCYGNYAAGTSASLVAGSASYAIRGLQSGSYVVEAEIDTLGTGQSNVDNPSGVSAVQSLPNGASVTTGVNVALTDPSGLVPMTPSLAEVDGENGSAIIQYRPNFNAEEQELATAYKVYWGTDTAASNGGSHSFAAQGPNTDVLILQGLANGATYFKMSTLIGSAESATTAVLGPVTVGTTSGANTVSGTVTFPGTATGPLIVGVHNNNAVYYQIIASPVSPQSYSFAGVPDATFQSFAIVDMDNDGIVTAGDLSNIGGFTNPPTVVVSGATVSDLTLGNAAEVGYVATNHFSDSVSNGYSLNVGSSDGTKRAVSVVLYSGPNIAVPFDLGAGANLNDIGVPFQNSSAPAVGADYLYYVTFSDGTSQDVISPVTGVINSLPSNLLVNAALPYSPNVPEFTWTAPSSLPAVYSYNVNVFGPDANWYYPQGGGGAAFTATSVVYDADGNASNPSLTAGVSYTWQVTVVDKVLGNSGTFQAPLYTP